MSNTISKKKKVALGIALAWVLSGLFIVLGYRLAETTRAFAAWNPNEAAAFALLLAGSTLVAGIGWAARTRHFGPHIDGSRPEDGSGLDMTLRFISNTSEQLVLFAIACFAFAQADPAMAVHLLPAAGIWFILARVMFLLGYRVKPTARAVGFAATFHPTIALFMFSAVRLF